MCAHVCSLAYYSDDDDDDNNNNPRLAAIAEEPLDALCHEERVVNKDVFETLSVINRRRSIFSMMIGFIWQFAPVTKFGPVTTTAL